MKKDPTLLIVDDDSSQLELLQIGLDRYNFTVLHALSGQEALKIINKKTPDIILLDYNMPQMDGPSLCQKIRQNPNVDYIPIIMLTARGDTKSKVIGLDSGADEYITKPFIIEEVVARLNSMLRLKELHDSLKTANNKLSILATTDEMTGILNYRSVITKLEEEMNKSKRYQLPLSIFLFDIDFFKKINDTYGHPVGDAVLKTFGKNIPKHIRNTDICGRYGGEEFLIVFPLTKAENSLFMAERFRSFIQQYIFHQQNIPFQVTISGGISGFKDNLPSAVEFVSCADKALYLAKNSGRNKIILYES